MATYTGLDGDSTNAFTIVAGGITITAGAVRLSDAGATFLGLGAAENATLACGAVTVTKPLVNLANESCMADQLDSITYTNVAEGDLLLLTHEANDGDLTVDDGNIDLGAATRVLSDNEPGHSLLLRRGPSTFSEVSFVQADNS